jgi:protein TonB
LTRARAIEGGELREHRETREVREPGGLFCAVLAGSISLHAGLVAIAPTAAGAKAPAMILASFVEIADPPAPALEPPVPREEPERKPMTEPRGAPATNARTRPIALPSPAATPAATPPASEPAADFTSTVLSSADGPGVAVPLRSTPPFAASSGRATVGSSATSLSSPRLRFVPLADLARPPRAPRLDAALEKNYPTTARQSGIAGQAVLRVQVLADGRIGAVRHVSETYAGFADACERTVKSGVWEPPLERDGKPVATEITYTCRFDVRA